MDKLEWRSFIGTDEQIKEILSVVRNGGSYFLRSPDGAVSIPNVCGDDERSLGIALVVYSHYAIDTQSKQQTAIQTTEIQDKIARNIRYVQGICHMHAAQAGWWTDLTTGEPKQSNPLAFGNATMLVVTELAEAIEGHRKDLMDDKLTHRKMNEVELADAVIRIFDLGGAYGLDIGGAIAEKLAYNATRADHKIENRIADGGKKY